MELAHPARGGEGWGVGGAEEEEVGITVGAEGAGPDGSGSAVATGKSRGIEEMVRGLPEWAGMAGAFRRVSCECNCQRRALPSSGTSTQNGKATIRDA